jgi:hypothetical protein
MSTNSNTTLFAKLSKIALKASPLLIIFYAIYNLYISVLGYMTVEEQSVDYKKTVKNRENSFIVGIVFSLFVILISATYGFSLFKSNKQ